MAPNTRECPPVIPPEAAAASAGWPGLGLDSPRRSVRISFRPYRLWSGFPCRHLEKSRRKASAGTPSFDCDEAVLAIELKDERLDGIVYRGGQVLTRARFHLDQFDRSLSGMLIGQ